MCQANDLVLLCCALSANPLVGRKTDCYWHLVIFLASYDSCSIPSYSLHSAEAKTNSREGGKVPSRFFRQVSTTFVIKCARLMIFHQRKCNSPLPLISDRTKGIGSVKVRELRHRQRAGGGGLDLSRGFGVG